MLSLAEVFAYRWQQFDCVSPYRDDIADALVSGVNDQFPAEKVRAYRDRGADTESTICVMLPAWQLRYLNRAELETTMRQHLGVMR